MTKKSRPIPEELKPVVKNNPKKSSKKSRPYQFSAVRIIILLLILLIPIGIFIGVVQLVKNQPVPLSSNLLGTSEMLDISADDYNQLVSNQTTAIIFIDQAGCITADGLRENLKNIAAENNFSFYRLMWADMKETNLKDVVKYYPSVVVLREGSPIAHLRADSDDDSAAYNSAADLTAWLEKYLVL